MVKKINEKKDNTATATTTITNQGRKNVEKGIKLLNTHFIKAKTKI